MLHFLIEGAFLKLFKGTVCINKRYSKNAITAAAREPLGAFDYLEEGNSDDKGTFEGV
jgi:hypothetical protein